MTIADSHRETRGRPSPEALLASAQREGRGRLKIFLGAAPGVGKTYEMLTSGRARRTEGVDVVIGVVETHGRSETQALVDGFEIVPRRLVDYKGRALDEMDLDAILTRRPALVHIGRTRALMLQGKKAEAKAALALAAKTEPENAEVIELKAKLK